jgi:hypothetical protein
VRWSRQCEQYAFWVPGRLEPKKRKLCAVGCRWHMRTVEHYYVISTYKNKQPTVILSSPQPSQCSFLVSFFIFMQLIFIHLCVFIRLFEVCMLSSLLINTFAEADHDPKPIVCRFS